MKLQVTAVSDATQRVYSGLTASSSNEIPRAFNGHRINPFEADIFPLPLPLPLPPRPKNHRRPSETATMKYLARTRRAKKEWEEEESGEKGALCNSLSSNKRPQRRKFRGECPPSEFAAVNFRQVQIIGFARSNRETVAPRRGNNSMNARGGTVAPKNQGAPENSIFGDSGRC
ncbi:hypothetical protein K0M31_012156 [Melipona bicolor]|uniref:Uncharacterized protein n=1 Tax=Melipona bicolor TaxID=60889 RepID=A0AA40KHJ5_9HYME|nr:hypothetical protein K0M31_012156 [Melipona bicolor]